MLHKHIRKHVSRLHAHIQEHGHKRALVMIMSSMVMMFYPYFSTRADLLPSGGDITVQYSPDNTEDVNTDVVATVVYTNASGTVVFAQSDTYTFTENGSYVFQYTEDGVPSAITATVDWIDKDAPIAEVNYSGDPATGPVTATLTTSEDVTITNNNNSNEYTFTQNGTFTFEFEDEAGNTGSALATVSSIVAGDICGNAIVESGEQCDAGQDNGDGISGCTETCQLEVAGGNGTGGTGSAPQQDICPNGDYSGSLYDNDCGTNPNNNTGDNNTGTNDTGSNDTGTQVVVLTGITATVTYTSGTTVTATATGFNMPGVFAVNNSNSLTYTFTSPGSFTFALQTAGGNTGSVTATATTGMFTTGSTNTGTTTPPPSTGTVNTGVVCDAGDIILTGALGGVYSLTTPVVVGGLFSINWATANNHCNPDQVVTVQLRDHNGQWITLGTGELDGTGVVFRSTGLAYTGLYSVFGTHASGTVYSYTGTSGQQLTGIYTVDTPYTIYTGAYTGAYTGLWTGYQVRILNASGVDLLSGARPFTIDNTTPSLTGLTFIISGANASGVVGSGGTFTLSFIGSELLSNVQLLVNNTLVKSWTGGSTTGYAFTGGFGATNMAGPIAYTVNFTDAAGNTGSVTGTNIYTIDTIDPNFQAFAVTGTAASGVKFSWNTTKSTVYNFQFTLSGSTGVVVPVTTTTYATSHNYTTTALATGKTYVFSIKINDALQNTNFMSGTVAVNASGAASVTIASQNNNILQLSAQVEAGLFAKMLRKEIENFEECKAELDINEVEIDLGSNKQITFGIPDVSKKTTKTILSTFASVLTAKLKSANLTATQLKDIENKSNNFFAVTALLQEGSCKQNLSAYHINLFENAMKQMKLQLFK